MITKWPLKYDRLARSMIQWSGRRRPAGGLEEGVERALEVDHVLAVGDRVGGCESAIPRTSW